MVIDALLLALTLARELLIIQTRFRLHWHTPSPVLRLLPNEEIVPAIAPIGGQ